MLGGGGFWCCVHRGLRAALESAEVLKRRSGPGDGALRNLTTAPSAREERLKSGQTATPPPLPPLPPPSAIEASCVRSTKG